MADAESAQKRWEIENEIETLPPSDEIFRYDGQEQQQFLSARKLLCKKKRLCCETMHLFKHVFLCLCLHQ